MSSQSTINRKKYYRVVLEGFDPKKANRDSFAIKMSVSTRTSLPRARQVLKGLPAVIKRDLDIVQANKLKNNLEQIGGLVRLESYLITVGEEENRELPRREREEVELTLRVTCSACGNEVGEGVEQCPSCGGAITVVEPTSSDSTAEAPAETPAEEKSAPAEPLHRPPRVEPVIHEEHSTDILGALVRNKFLVAAVLLMILLLISILKQ